MRNSRARITLTLSYTAFLLVAGAAVLAGVYVVVRFLPGYPLISNDPSQIQVPTSRGEILDTLVELSLWIMLGFLVIGVLGGWLVSGWVLRPLRTIEAGARQIASGDLDHRIRLDRRDEFGDLARTFDTMVGRLQAIVAAQRRFAANASHELRTPLSTMSVLLESATNHPAQTDVAALLRSLSVENSRAVALMEALLRLHAAGGRDTSADDAVDLAELTRRVSEEQSAVEPPNGSAQLPTRHPAPALVVADPLLMRQLVENLFRNAIQHGNGSVRIACESSCVQGGDEGVVTLTVENGGDPIAPETLARLTEPLFRASGRAQNPHDGVGLGLALVEQIVHTHSGALEFSSPPAGGLSVRVSLPAAPRD